MRFLHAPNAEQAAAPDGRLRRPRVTARALDRPGRRRSEIHLCRTSLAYRPGSDLARRADAPQLLTMTISRKHRRAITVRGHEYIWYVKPDDANLDQPTLTVVSSDRRFFIRYVVLQNDELRHVTVLGREFRAATCGGTWRRFRCPTFGDGSAVTPRDVRSLIEWAQSSEPTPDEVDWRGVLLSPNPEAV